MHEDILTDHEVVQLVLKRDKDAFAELVKRYERSVLAVVLSILPNWHEAEDITQEVFVLAFKKLHSLKDGAKFGAWLHTIARRQAANTAKQGKTMLFFNQTLENRSNVSANPLKTDDFRLLNALSRLKTQERIIVSLRYFDGHSIKEIADITGRTIGSVTKQLTRIRRRLYTLLGKE